MYCHQYFFGGKYDLIQHKLYIKMMGMKSSPKAFYIQILKETKKMTWLQSEFVLNFSPANGQPKLGRTAAKQLLTLEYILSTNVLLEFSMRFIF